MELCSNGLKISTKPQIILLVILISSQISVKTMGRVPVCGKTNKVKSNCDNKSFAFLWTIKRKVAPALIETEPSPPSYFFGTIHVPYSRVWDSIPDGVKMAFETSDSIFFELDLLDAYTVSTLAKCQVLPKGIRLKDILPISLYKRLKRHLEYIRRILPTWVTPDQRARGLYAEYLFNAITGNWERKRPIWVMLMVNSLNEHDIKSRGTPVLDLFLAQEAQRLNKKIGSVERVEEQCIPLNGLNFTQVLFALNQTLYQHESIRRGRSQSKVNTDELIQHYNCGDINKIIFNYDSTNFFSLKNSSKNSSLNLNSKEVKFAKHIDDYFRSELIVKRNKRMSRRVVNILEDNPNQSFFFAFGAGNQSYTLKTLFTGIYV